ncbi:hypothetical protein QJS04_geneDACA020401 [Acorus gramineus]|uniref:Uncharacterized protein n=1 Tax=Acorus gramineus TaxID=55184 RepID=A0AAV9BQC2_ACOGR|nr:hypothetical protein QJS04_geneDACA020401 [Acorus gramineus]
MIHLDPQTAHYNNTNVLNSSEPTRAHNYDAGNMHKVITRWNIVGERNSGGQREFPL